MTEDSLAKAIAAANARIAEVYKNGRNTLIDQLTLEQFLDPIGANEKALVGAYSVHELDEDEQMMMAAA